MTTGQGRPHRIVLPCAWLSACRTPVSAAHLGSTGASAGVSVGSWHLPVAEQVGPHVHALAALPRQLALLAHEDDRAVHARPCASRAQRGKANTPRRRSLLVFICIYTCNMPCGAQRTTRRTAPGQARRTDARKEKQQEEGLPGLQHHTAEHAHAIGIPVCARACSVRERERVLPPRTFRA
jgi:hypothetical protein